MSGGTITGTPLQVWTLALLDLLDDARDVLSEREYRVLVDCAVCRIAREAARITEWERNP